jgi:transglutaminase-like putative cysteine protease
VELRETIRLRVGCSFTYELAIPAPAIVQVAVRRGESARVLTEAWELPAADELRDPYGNSLWRAMLRPPVAGIRYDAVVEVPPDADETCQDARQHPIDELPAEPLHFLLTSRYCESDALAAEALRLFGGLPSGWPLAQAVCDWVNANVGFRYGASDAGTSARDVYRRREGVCRDLAHLFVALCRALGIPARYVFGYLPDLFVEPLPVPMDFYAWAEVYLGGRWWTFDPRNNRRRVGRVVVGRGRDAADVAMVTTWGAVRLTGFEVWAAEALK